MLFACLNNPLWNIGAVRFRPWVQCLIKKVMETTNKLFYSSTKEYIEEGQKYRITVKISLDDDCKNNCPDWSVTANIWHIEKQGYLTLERGGCCHEEILKHFPELRPFVILHLCNFLGQPMYSVSNGIYYIKKDVSIAKHYLRITDSEAAELYVASEDEDFFKYKLYKLGIVDRWKEESDIAIREMERMTGLKWVNPYTKEQLRFVLSPDGLDAAEEKIATGYYTESAIRKRNEEKAIKKKEACRKQILNDCERECARSIEKRDVLLAVLDYGLPIDNVIYYNDRKTLSFNWLSYKDKITKEQFEEFVTNVDRSRLPKDIQFELNN